MGEFCVYKSEVRSCCLPLLVRVSSKPSAVFDRILFAHMLYEMRYSGSVCRSQRYYSEIFNRSSSSKFSVSRRLLERDGWVVRSSLSVGHASDCYVRGKRFDGEPYLLRSWLSLARNLWGRDGLLRNWSESPGWGFGCLGVSGMLVFATVERADCLLSRKQILTIWRRSVVMKLCVDQLRDLLISAFLLRRLMVLVCLSVGASDLWSLLVNPLQVKRGLKKETFKDKASVLRDVRRLSVVC